MEGKERMTEKERMRYDGEERVEGWRGERGGIHASLEPRLSPPPLHMMSHCIPRLIVGAAGL